MLDLDAIIDQTIQIKIKGKLIHVNQPSAKLVKKMTSMQGLSEEELMDKQIEIVADILNNNTSAANFTLEEVSEFPQVALTAILNGITGNINSINKNPN